METAAVSPTLTLDQRLGECVSLVKKAVANHDDSFLLRALRKTTLIRKNISVEDFSKSLKRLLPRRSVVSESIFSLVDATTPFTTTMTAGEEDSVDDVHLYLHHTAVHFAQTHRCCSAPALAKAASMMLSHLSSCTVMDVLRARALHTYALICLKTDYEKILPLIFTLHRQACLNAHTSTQAVCINLILRTLIQHKRIGEAQMFAQKANFPLEASNNAQIRNLLFMGRLFALQLEYSQSLTCLLHAVRKLPPTFHGISLKLYKLAVVVTLLTGDLPDRKWFSLSEFKRPLLPYFELVNAVRSGKIHLFELVQTQHGDCFRADQLDSLISRLHSSVIKTGLRSVGLSYSKISLQDVATKLELNNSEEALYLVAKAIRDGVLEASIVGESVCSKESIDVYTHTSEPSQAFSRRITFLVQAHNDAVKSLRFPSAKRIGDVEEDKKKKKEDEELDEAELEALVNMEEEED